MAGIERRLERLESASTQEPLIDFSDFTDDELKALLEGYDRLVIEELSSRGRTSPGIYSQSASGVPSSTWSGLWQRASKERGGLR